MKGEPIPDYVLTPHARVEMNRRGLSDELIRTVLEAPERRLALRPGRHVLQSRIPMGDPAKEYVVRVLVNVDRSPNEVVTAYRTSKIDKYWRQEP
jgi:hypothetical protein